MKVPGLRLLLALTHVSLLLLQAAAAETVAQKNDATTAKPKFKSLPFHAKCAERDLTFCLTFDRKSVAADASLGNPEPFHFKGHLEDRVIQGFDGQNAFSRFENEELKYDVVKNIDHRKGTISFWVMAEDYAPKDVQAGDPENSHKAYLHVYFRNGNDWVRFVVYQFYSDPKAFFYWQNSACDSQVWRVAGLPLYDVGQGEWFQVTITWDEKRIRIYRNGDLTGEAELPEEAQKLADLQPVSAQSFIGVRHVAFEPADAKNRTAIDDLKIYRRVLSDTEIKNNYARLVEAVDGAAEAVRSIGIRLDGVDDGANDPRHLQVALDFNALPKEWFDLLTAKKLKGRYTLTSPSGKTMRGTWNPDQTQEQRILAGVRDAGKYQFEITLTAPDGKTEKASASVVRPDTSWFGNTLGLEDTVPSPWTPITLREKDRITLWNREYEFRDGPFPTSVKVGGESVLVQSPRLQVATRAGPAPIAWKTRNRIARKSFIEISGIGRSKEFAIHWKTRIDFDGVIGSSFLVRGNPAITSMRLVWTVAPQFSRYLMNPLLKQTGKGTYEGALGLGGAFTPEENNVLWLTSEQKGFAWSLESDANWIYGKGEKVLRTVVDDQGGHCEVAMITRPVQVPPHTSYHAYFVATPSRPLPERARTYHLGGYGQLSNGEVSFVHHAGEGFDGNVFSFQPAADFPDVVAEFKSWGQYAKSFMPYGAATALNDQSPVGNYFAKYWKIGYATASVQFENKRKKLKMMQTNTCPGTRYSDYILSTIRALFEHPAQMHSGIYYDLVVNYVCGNELHGHKFKDHFGRDISPYIIRSLRRHILRTVRYCHDHGRVVMLHDWSRFNPVIHGLGDYWYPGEQYGDLIQRKRSPYIYSDVISHDEYRSELNMHPKGTGILFLGNLKRADESYGTEEQTKAMCTKLLLHDVPISAAFEDPGVINRLWGIFNAYDMDHAEYHPYYAQQEITSSSPAIAVTYYQCTGGRYLAVLGNLTAQEQSATIHLAGLKTGIQKVRDEYEERDIPLRGSTFKVTIPARHFVIAGF